LIVALGTMVGRGTAKAMIIVTGSAGLIGRGIVALLRRRGMAVREFDIRSDPRHDTRDKAALGEALKGATGVIHLAAISRVVWAQRNPVLAHEVNVDALRGLFEIVGGMKHKPWVVFASSREVYGEQDRLPVREDAPFRPMNHYAHGKLAGEALVEAARETGIRTATCRFSNVFGSIEDHSDRVAVAFARSAALGGRLVIEGGENRFDFTNVDDVVRGLGLVVDAIAIGESLPPLHFVSGRSTSLFQLADLARQFARRPVSIAEAPSRSFDVSRFCGDPERARALLGWEAEIDLERGFAALVDGFIDCGHDASSAHWLDRLTDPADAEIAAN